jgi:hypothetical protein
LSALRQQLYRHELRVDAADWRAWAGADENRDALATRLLALGLRRAAAQALWQRATTDSRLVCAGRAGRQRAPGAGAGRRRRVCAAVPRPRGCCTPPSIAPSPSPGDIFTQVPSTWWSVLTRRQQHRPHARTPAPAGCVQLRVHGRLAARPVPSRARRRRQDGETCPPLSAELAAALDERPERAAPHAVAPVARRRPPGPAAAAGGGTLLATAALMLELLLFRGLFEISAQLAGPAQQVAAMAALLLPSWRLLVLVEWPIVREALRLGRHLETRLRVALAAPAAAAARPLLPEPADLGHGRPQPRHPGGARRCRSWLLQHCSRCWNWCSPWPRVPGWRRPVPAGRWRWPAVALAVPLLAQPVLAERDLRVRTHGAALSGFTLDALLGLVPVRAHRAERALRREHEGLLVDWARALRGWIVASLAADGVQGLLCIGLAGGLVLSHFQQQGGVGGSDLLLVFWTLKLPALGQRIAGLAETAAGLAQRADAPARAAAGALKPWQRQHGRAGGAPPAAAGPRARAWQRRSCRLASRLRIRNGQRAGRWPRHPA